MASITSNSNNSSDSSKPTPDRANTDERLQQERRNSDQAIADQKAAVEADADLVVDRAREHADAVLQEAREKADKKLRVAKPDAESGAVIATERKIEDRAIEQERAIADESLLREREQNARDLLALLPLERLHTDRSLLTERVRSDDALAHRDDFLGMVSHDLRDLLGGIVSTAAVLLRTAPSGEAGAAAKAGGERIQRYAARMKRLIEDLTDLVSIDAGKLAIVPLPGNLAPLVSEAVGSLRAAAAAKGISLDVPSAELRLPANFDAGRMLQVVTNLVANSIKFTPVGGQIRVACVQTGETLQMSVSDTGPGIAPDLLEVIFQRFRQAGHDDQRGLGLGLYISRTLIEAHGGRIWAESKLGTGTTIVFTLPASQTVASTIA
jgi:signal transduction histidine kinase